MERGVDPPRPPARCGSWDLQVSGQQPQGRQRMGGVRGNPRWQVAPQDHYAPAYPQREASPTPARAPGTSAPIAAPGCLLLRVQHLRAIGEDTGGVQHDALLGLGVEDLKEWEVDAREQRLRPALPAASFPPHRNAKPLLQEAP